MIALLLAALLGQVTADLGDGNGLYYAAGNLSLYCNARVLVDGHNVGYASPHTCDLLTAHAIDVGLTMTSSAPYNRTTAADLYAFCMLLEPAPCR